MKTEIFSDYTFLSEQVAHRIAGIVREKPEAVLCLAAGDTPRLTYALLAAMSKKEHIDFSECTFIGLDEWVGIPPTNEGSCHFFLKTHLFDPLGIADRQINLFDASSTDLQRECLKMDTRIREKGGIDLILVGVGMNGHIGFNEPGVSFDHYSHVATLDTTTRNVGQKYFKKTTALTYGITLGLRHLLEAGRAIMMASGQHKAGVVRAALEGAVSEQLPAGIIRKHPNGIVMLDEEAASLLTV